MKPLSKIKNNQNRPGLNANNMIFDKTYLSTLAKMYK